ncbi:hypothetical protein BDZ88DRAFT_440126 [Geranomyces variabilis]|nr:hypothetical protein BDZ88DRAFT_440126 [Geranomyces variabilis]
MRTETETLAHSWIVDLGEDWVAELVPTDRGALVDLAQERAFSCGKLDRNIDAFMQSADVYRRCEAQPQELERQNEEDRTMRRASGWPSPLSQMSASTKARTQPDTRSCSSFTRCSSFCLPLGQRKVACGPPMKPKCFRVTGMRSIPVPKGIRVMDAEEIQAASKNRKLLAYGDTHRRGLQADKPGWHRRANRSAGVRESHKDGTNARFKATKGAKDCAGFAFGRSGHLTETFAATWLGTDWECRPVSKGFRGWVKSFGTCLRFNDTLHAVSRAFAKAPSGRPAERHWVTPKSATKTRPCDEDESASCPDYFEKPPHLLKRRAEGPGKAKPSPTSANPGCVQGRRGINGTEQWERNPYASAATASRRRPHYRHPIAHWTQILSLASVAIGPPLAISTDRILARQANTVCTIALAAGSGIFLGDGTPDPSQSIEAFKATGTNTTTCRCRIPIRPLELPLGLIPSFTYKWSYL